jgi:hypothetical protein
LADFPINDLIIETSACGRVPCDRLFLGCTFDFSEGECVGDHFDVNLGGGWYAHGDRVKAAASA